MYVCRDCPSVLTPVPGLPPTSQPLLCPGCKRRVRREQKKRARAQKPKKFGPTKLPGTWLSRRSLRIRAYVDSLKISPCMDCGGRFPPVAMDFDHRLDTFKVREVSRCQTRTQVDAEVARCDLICSNCHRVRTAARDLRGRSDELQSWLDHEELVGT